jgi:hypothetical protein
MMPAFLTTGSARTSTLPLEKQPENNLTGTA